MYYVNSAMRILGNIIKALIVLGMIAAVLVIGIFLFNIDIKFGSTSTANSGGQQIMFTVQPGDTVDTIGQNLKQQGIIDSPLMFKIQIKLKGTEKDLKAGQFQVTTGMNMDKLITTLTTSPTELGVKFQVIEGWRVGEIAEKLGAKSVVDSGKFTQLASWPIHVAFLVLSRTKCGRA